MRQGGVVVAELSVSDVLGELAHALRHHSHASAESHDEFTTVVENNEGGCESDSNPDFARCRLF
jgi:hypothetical protein